MVVRIIVIKRLNQPHLYLTSLISLPNNLFFPPSFTPFRQIVNHIQTNQPTATDCPVFLVQCPNGGAAYTRF